MKKDAKLTARPVPTARGKGGGHTHGEKWASKLVAGMVDRESKKEVRGKPAHVRGKQPTWEVAARDEKL